MGGGGGWGDLKPETEAHTIYVLPRYQSKVLNVLGGVLDPDPHCSAWLSLGSGFGSAWIRFALELSDLDSDSLIST